MLQTCFGQNRLSPAEKENKTDGKWTLNKRNLTFSSLCVFNVVGHFMSAMKLAQIQQHEHQASIVSRQNKGLLYSEIVSQVCKFT